MSLYDYQKSKEADRDYDFGALLMAVMRQADDINLAKLGQAFPEELAELKARYNAPGGLLDHEK